jgi:hypothetical protein
MDGPKSETYTLSQVTPIKPLVNEKVITALRAALKEAKEGKIQAVGIAIACLDPEGDSGRATETILSAADGWYHSLSCAVNGLAFRLNYERYSQGNKMPDPAVEDGDE